MRPPCPLNSPYRRLLSLRRARKSSDRESWLRCREKDKRIRNPRMISTSCARGKEWWGKFPPSGERKLSAFWWAINRKAEMAWSDGTSVDLFRSFQIEISGFQTVWECLEIWFGVENVESINIETREIRIRRLARVGSRIGQWEENFQ